jgi:acyl-CoA thioester hydrolase
MGNHKASAVDSGAALAGELTDTGHRLEARIYCADTDFSGVVYHARYLEFLERGRIEYLRLVGVGLFERGDEQLAWIIRRLEIDFRRPARIDDLVTVETMTAEISSARVLLTQTMRRVADILITARVECALVNSSGRPQRFPKHWKKLFRPQNDLTKVRA